VIRVGAIGCGDIAQRSHFPNMAKLADRARLVAVAARNRERVEACARRFGIERAYTDVDAMLSEGDVDAVLILTPPDAHAGYAIKAVEAGKHVLVEKPMVRTLDEAQQILAAVEKNPVVFMPLPHVWGPDYEVLRELVESGAVGEVTSIECHKGHRGPTHADWFYRKEIAGGGVLLDLGIYAIGGVVNVFGPATKVQAMCATRYPERRMDDGSIVRPDVEDHCMLNLWLESNVAVFINSTWNGYLSHHHTRSRITVFGREGMIHFGVPDGAIYVHRDDGDYSKVPHPHEAASFDGYPSVRVTPPSRTRSGSLLEHFFHRIETGDTSTLPLKQQIHVTEIMLAAYESGALEKARSLTTRF